MDRHSGAWPRTSCGSGWRSARRASAVIAPVDEDGSQHLPPRRRRPSEVDPRAPARPAGRRRSSSSRAPRRSTPTSCAGRPRGARGPAGFRTGAGAVRRAPLRRGGSRAPRRRLPEGQGRDPLYARRRELTTVVALACDEVEPECFCTAVGGSPVGTEGVDLQIVPFGDDWLVRPLTDKGQALVRETRLGRAPAPEATGRWPRIRSAAWPSRSSATRCPRSGGDPRERVRQIRVWEEVARALPELQHLRLRLPLLFLFRRAPRRQRLGWREFRRWDACTYALFTAPRLGPQPARPDQTHATGSGCCTSSPISRRGGRRIRCVGCGRCIAQCPAGIDIHEAVREVAATSARRSRCSWLKQRCQPLPAAPDAHRGDARRDPRRADADPASSPTRTRRAVSRAGSRGSSASSPSSGRASASSPSPTRGAAAGQDGAPDHRVHLPRHRQGHPRAARP